MNYFFTFLIKRLHKRLYMSSKPLFKGFRELNNTTFEGLRSTRQWIFHCVCCCWVSHTLLTFSEDKPEAEQIQPHQPLAQSAALPPLLQSESRTQLPKHDQKQCSDAFFPCSWCCSGSDCIDSCQNDVWLFFSTLSVMMCLYPSSQKLKHSGEESGWEEAFSH